MPTLVYSDYVESVYFGLRNDVGHNILLILLRQTQNVLIFFHSRDLMTSIICMILTGFLIEADKLIE